MKQLFLAIMLLFSLCGHTQLFTLGVQGSSTANGQGVPTDSSWVMKVKKYYKQQGKIDTLHKIAASTLDIYSGMWTGYVPESTAVPCQSPGPFCTRKLPNISYNCTRLITRTPKPDIVIVNYPSTSYDWLPTKEVVQRLQDIKNFYNTQGVICFITTTQPREAYLDQGFYTYADRYKLKRLRDTIIQVFGSYAIDFYTVLADPVTLKRKPEYALPGDMVHINSAGHEQLFRKVIEKNILNVIPPAINQSPVAFAGNDITITLPTKSVQLKGSGTDADGTIVAYRWTKIAGPAQYNIVSPGSAQTTVNNLAQGVYQFELLVTDNEAAIAKDTVTVTVSPASPPPNQDPVANAGNDISISLPANIVLLEGSGTDADGTIVAYNWIMIAGPVQYNIASPGAAQTEVNNLIQGVYQFQLSVTDNNSAIAKDTVRVTVNEVAPPTNQSPVALAGNDISISIPTKSVLLEGSGTDADGTVVAYSWTKIAGPSQFDIVSPDAAQTIVDNLADGVYQFELLVTDNEGAIAKDTVMVTVNKSTSSNQDPVANAGNNQTITLPSNSVSLSGSGTDADGTVVAYNWTKIAGPAQYNIVSPGAAQTTVNNLEQGVYQFELSVTDNEGAIAKDTVIVTVNTPSNQNPVANAGNNQTVTLPSNSVSLSGSGTDADGTVVAYNWTKIAGPAQYNIVSPGAAQTTVNNLEQGVYQFELLVTDNEGAVAKDTVIVTVNTPTNQDPVANAGNDITITLPINTVSLAGNGTDADGTVVAYNWTKIAGPAQYNIVSPGTAQTTVNNLVQGAYQFRLQVTDNSGAIDTDTVLVSVNAAPPPPNSSQRVLIDAGQSSTITSSPDQWGKNWNNMTDARIGIRVNNAVAIDNSPTTIKLEVLNPIGTTATYDAGVTTGGSVGNVGNNYPSTSTNDNAFANINVTNGRWRIYGLDPARTYTIKFWGSRALSGSRFIQIKRFDETTWREYNASLNTNYNTAAVFTFSGKTEMIFNIRVKAGSTYSYISVVDIISNETVSGSIAARQALPKEVITNKKSKIFPNPTDGSIVNLRLENIFKGKVEISIMNSEGRLIKQLEANKNSDVLDLPVDISYLKAGTYYFRIKTKEDTEVVSWIRF